MCTRQCHSLPSHLITKIKKTRTTGSAQINCHFPQTVSVPYSANAKVRLPIRSLQKGPCSPMKGISSSTSKCYPSWVEIRNRLPQILQTPRACILSEFYIHGNVYRNYILIRSNEMQQYAGVYLLQNYSTCFGCPSHPSSAVHKTVTAASGTGHSIVATTFLHRGLFATLDEGCCSDTMTCTRSCSYSFMYS